MGETVENSSVLFNLNKTQLRPLLEVVAGGPVAHFTVKARPAVEGDRSGDKQFCTFHYATPEGKSGEATLFAKRCVWKGRSEAVHYRYLAAKGVPTPRLYGTLYDEIGTEILFLESLTTIGFRNDEETEWRAMLSLLARLNACKITPDYAPHLHRYEQVGTIAGNLWLLGLDANPPEEEVENDLRACGLADKDISALRQAARTLFAQIAAQPQGLLHQDFLPDNLGRRGEHKEMVVFDLHKNALGPRFADVAPYLALPDWSNRTAFLDSAETGAAGRRETLSQHYLNEYARFGGPTVSLQTFREESAALSWAHKISAMAWLAGQNQQARLREVVEFLSHVSLGTQSALR